MPYVEIKHDLDLDPELPEEFKNIAAELGECENTKLQVIDDFRKFILEHDGCKPHRTDDDYLQKFLRARFWHIESSYQLVNNINNIFQWSLRHISEVQVFLHSKK